MPELSILHEKQLRVGNFVTDQFWDTFSKVITVESINDKGINLEIQNSDDYPEMQSHWIEPYYTFDDLRGIPLTEDWLIRAGFEKTEEYDFGISGNKVPRFEKNGISIMLSGGQLWYATRQYDGGTSDPYEPVREVDHIHQLQNLYFALTGTELEII